MEQKIKDVKAGEKLTPDNIRIIRPGFGLSPQYFQEILGKKSLTDISRGTALSWEHVK